MGLSDYTRLYRGDINIISAYRGMTPVFGDMAPSAPVLLSAPAVAGSLTVGGILTATPGAYSGSPVVSREWLRDGVPIMAETGLTHTVVQADVGTLLSVRETAITAGGTLTTISEALGPVPAEVEVLSETHVFLLAGQSNMVGRATWDSGAAPDTSRTFQIARGASLANGSGAESGSVVAWRAPLDHWGVYASQFGPDVQFAIDYLAANPNVTLVFVPGARGATSFGSGNYYWGAGNNLSNDAISRTNAYLAAHPEAVFKGILWHQGESDGDIGRSGESYQSVLDAQLTAFRTGITGAANVPVVVGQMGTWALNDGRLPLQDVITATPNRLARTACVSSYGLTANGDNLHFNAAGQRGLGARYYAALAVAAANASPAAAVPGRFGSAFWSVATGAGAGKVVLTVSGLPGNGGSALTAIEYSVDGGTSWTSIGGTATGAYTLTLGTAGASHSMTLRAVNAAGSGVANDAKTVTSGTVSGSWSVTASDGTLTVTETPSAPVTPAIASVGDGTITLSA